MIDLDTARAEITGIVNAEAFAELFEHSGASALVREGTSEHVTASCLVIDPAAEAVLLNHHRKAGAWMQFGGHLEPGDVSLREAARREALEESGIGSLSWVSPAPIDLDIHELAGDFGTCRRHFDVIYGAVAETADLPRVSEESIDVAWFPVGRLPEDLMPDLVERLPQLYRATAEVFAQGA
ncbi:MULTISPECIES: NUDIX hydrolase [Brevibacterium]|uniref:NUDIX hydrolase n=1 Tax=Brevibacterium casei S18 TaxID=1229781 RepID=K9AQB4_9MICO|nr:NUDIX domain-containing protein [Brevibacterium casei]EKU49454.1 NUDIX hydrolase [Brevibacterium casei S18]